MTRVGARLVGTAMTAGAVLALLAVHGIMGPEPVGASQCCQTCEAKEAACYSACEAMSHDLNDEDSLEECHGTCDYVLYDGYYACWAHCVYCEPPGPQRCFQYLTQHYFGECKVPQPGGGCYEYDVMEEVVWEWEVGC